MANKLNLDEKVLERLDTTTRRLRWMARDARYAATSHDDAGLGRVAATSGTYVQELWELIKAINPGSTISDNTRLAAATRSLHSAYGTANDGLNLLVTAQNLAPDTHGWTRAGWDALEEASVYFGHAWADALAAYESLTGVMLAKQD